MKGLINGTSLRVPVSNGSLLDLNIQLSNNKVSINDIIELIKSNDLYKIVYDINDKNLVSCDFITTTTPTILDKYASIDMGNGRFKFFLWYDNEWSYSAQLIRLCESMYNFNISKNIFKFNNILLNETKYYLENLDLEGKRVVLRLDLNVPIKNNIITDDYRIQSGIPTINSILKKNPSKLIICSHFGRPKGKETKYSLSNILSTLNKYLELNIELVDFDNLTIDKIMNSNNKVFLLENLRFFEEETEYEKGMLRLDNNYVVNTYSKLGDVYILDAFGCAHRNHMSIGGIKEFELELGKTIGYGHLIHKEITNLSSLVNKNKKILCVVGGNKVEDKLPIVKSFSNLHNVKIFVAGGMAKYYIEQMVLGNQTINSNLTIMKDGWGGNTLTDNPQYIPDISNTELNCFDIGPVSKAELFKMVSEVDIIFWNGSLGVIENDFYSQSSKQFVKFLESNYNVKTIIGGGETASLITNKSSNIYVSTGGGALLEFLELKFNSGNNLPGISIFE